MKNTCQQCKYFARFGTEIRGQCYGMPPLPFASGSMIRAIVKVDDTACSLFVSLAPNEPTVVKEKKQPETVGHAIKAARQAK
tara:strand:+ start:10068 stop:10313 length:246 start_codon:yes stop_codon:yes gene_type:complete